MLRHALAASVVCAAATAGEPTMKFGFVDTGNGLTYEGNGWTLAGTEGPGWTSLKVGTAEFLAASDKVGAILYRKGEHWFTHYPSHSLLSHDASLGHNGHFADGINMIKISPAWYRNEFELYLGANEKEDQAVVMFLNDDVAFIRLGGGDQNRAWAQGVIDRKAKGLRKTRDAVVVHQSGPALTVKSTRSPGKNDKGADLPPPEFEVGLVKDPAGTERLALLFPCKGFVANAYQFGVETRTVADNFVHTPKFRVSSSDDPKGQGYVHGPTNGVLNPEYKPQTKLDFAIEFGWLGAQPFTGYVEVEIVHALGKRQFYERQELKGGAPDKNGRLVATFQPRFQTPGVHEVWGRILAADGSLVWIDRYRAGWDLENFQPDLRAEADLKAFWDKTLADLRAVPLAPETVRVKEFEDHPKFEIYDVTVGSLNQQRLHLMLYVPKAGARPLPAIVTAHPGITGFGVSKRPDGVYGSELRQDPRFVTIVPLIRGHAPDAKDIPFNHPWWGPLDSRDNYAARFWYCAMVRAVDYLATRPELVDMKRLVASGGSQGGALALVTAALDPRVAVCLSDCPACCQQFEIMENYPSFGPTKGQVPPGQTLADVEKMLSYYNPVNLCPWITCPTYVGSNIGDLTVHSMGCLAAYANLTGVKATDKAFYPGFTAAHGSGPGLGVKSKEWLEKLGGPLPDKPAK